MATRPGSGQSCKLAPSSLGLSILCAKRSHLEEKDGEPRREGGGHRADPGQTLSFHTLSPCMKGQAHLPWV